MKAHGKSTAFGFEVFHLYLAVHKVHNLIDQSKPQTVPLLFSRRVLLVKFIENLFLILHAGAFIGDGKDDLSAIPMLMQGDLSVFGAEFDGVFNEISPNVHKKGGIVVYVNLFQIPLDLYIFLRPGRRQQNDHFTDLLV